MSSVVKGLKTSAFILANLRRLAYALSDVPITDVQMSRFSIRAIRGEVLLSDHDDYVRCRAISAIFFPQFLCASLRPLW